MNVAHRRYQFFLADLAAIIALAGLILALARSLSQNGPPVGIFVLVGLVVVIWRSFRVMRALPVCERCERRFYLPPPKPKPAVCPECGHPEQRSDRMRKRLAVASWAILAILLLTGSLIRLLPMEFVGSPIDVLPWIALRLALPLLTLVLLALFLALLFARLRHALPGVKPVPCENCGATFSMNEAPTPIVCPRCLQGRPPMTQTQKENVKLGRRILAVILVLTLLAVFFLPDFISDHFGFNYWIALPLAIATALIGIPAAGFVFLVLRQGAVSA
jgi:DNA-directed RNA polymerase subunit RPC12/RpoP